ncbi:MAG: hypothetical protein N2507_02625 [Candidatus Bipolaricaulota bacterium]|nr:hypothetical protein [Candidatus Bipolaricaulota bacterium]MCX7844243.1 hypothetical protein [Candidatus Bipolaricaulota bacterium]MDW8151862.1 hypothetical protein [Candidatus Bipolaricaulota bacterium]
MRDRPWILITLGVLGLITGVVLPFLMVLRILASTFALNFLAFAASLGGLFLGMLGLAEYVRPGGRRGPDE